MTSSLPMDEEGLRFHAELRAVLQAERDSGKFEQVVAALIADLLKVPICVARSGFQYGADAGPAGRLGRRFRIECKKYAHDTQFNDRELLGEIDQALDRDEALEAWILATTGTVREQSVHGLTQKGERSGVPVLILDWSEHRLSSLGALFAHQPAIVARMFSVAAGELARALQPYATDAVSLLRKELASWTLGFASLRQLGHAHLQSVRSSPVESTAALGQDVSCAAHKRLKRVEVTRQLSGWWTDGTNDCSPAVAVGREGAGKTWAALDWMAEHLGDLPITLLIPSSASAALLPSEIGIREFLAARLHELAGTQDRSHWLHRLDRLLRRPLEEGPVLLVLLDGLNQEPSVPWLRVIQVLQSKPFAGRIRLLLTTRQHHYEDRLGAFKSLAIAPARITVGDYSTEPGGELDQMLAMEGLTRDDMRPDLLQLAENPRLFRLVVRFGAQLVEAGSVTVHRLLWEYGRDTFGVRGGHSFSENEWRGWLGGIARKHRDGVREYTLRALGETTVRPDLTEKEVYARLSDIVDGRFAHQLTLDRWEFRPEVVTHALGAALLVELWDSEHLGRRKLAEQLDQWLDPIAGLDQRAEILRAAVSILVEEGIARRGHATSVLLGAWLHTQNVSDEHRREIGALAEDLAEALLDALETSVSDTHASARKWALSSLHGMRRSSTVIQGAIRERTRRWFAFIPQEVRARDGRERNGYASNLIAVLSSGAEPRVIRVADITLHVGEGCDPVLLDIAPALLEGIALAPMRSVIATAAAAAALLGPMDSWAALRWLALFNPIDPEAMADAARTIASQFLDDKSADLPQGGVARRAAALMLTLCGEERDEVTADATDATAEEIHFLQPREDGVGIELGWLSAKGMRNALTDASVPLVERLSRSYPLWVDPSFNPPPFESALCSETQAPSDGLSRIAAARCSPKILEMLVRRDLTVKHSDAAQWRGSGGAKRFATHVQQRMGSLLILGKQNITEVDPSFELFRERALEEDQFSMRMHCLLIEVCSLPALAQLEALIASRVPLVGPEVAPVLRPPSVADVDSLIETWIDSADLHRTKLIGLLSVSGATVSDDAWRRLAPQAVNRELRGFIYEILSRTDAVRFGRELLSERWAYDGFDNVWANHHASGALLEVTGDWAFEHVVERVASWRVLEAARRRGSRPAEIRVAAAVISRVLQRSGEGPGVQEFAHVIDRSHRRSAPFRVVVLPSKSGLGWCEWASLSALESAEWFPVNNFNVIKEIRAAHQAGMSLFCIDVALEDIVPILEHAPDAVDTWIEGMDARSHEFVQRVRMAEGFYLSLTEALLTHSPSVGARLWRAIAHTTNSVYFCAALTDERINMLFRAPDSADVDRLRADLLDTLMKRCDASLRDVSVAASYAGRADWLFAFAQRDSTSDSAWRRKRGIALSGYSPNHHAPVHCAWNDATKWNAGTALATGARWLRWFDAHARYWWERYLSANTPEDAFAAWEIFLNVADHRIFAWDDFPASLIADVSELGRMKRCHVLLNMRELQGRAARSRGILLKMFLGRRISKGIAPWR